MVKYRCRVCGHRIEMRPDGYCPVCDKEVTMDDVGCEPDYIERESLIKLAESIAHNIDPNFPTEAVTVLANFLPAADVEPVKHGRWVQKHDADSWSNWVVCSECGTAGSPNWKRCPECEAKMDGDLNGPVHGN